MFESGERNMGKRQRVVFPDTRTGISEMERVKGCGWHREREVESGN